MKECDIFRGSHTLTPPTYFQGVRSQDSQSPGIYAPTCFYTIGAVTPPPKKAEPKRPLLRFLGPAIRL